MRLVSSGRARGRALLLASTLLATASIAPAFAQTAPAPETYRNDDEQGVDLTTGTYNFELAEGGVGDIAITRYWGQSGWRDNWSGDLRLTDEGATQVATVNFGRISERFTRSGTVWASAKSNGATLVDTTDGQLYTASDGTKVTFTSPLRLINSDDPSPTIIMPEIFCGSTNATGCSVPTKITRPTGQRYDLAWTVGQQCAFDADRNAHCKVTYRLQDVRSKSGFAVKLKYQSDAPYSGSVTDQQPPQTGWFKRSTARFFDLSQVYCDPIAYDCDAVAASATVAYGYPASTTRTVTDERGGIWTLTSDAANHLTGIRRPGSAADTTTINWGTNGRVSQVTTNGETKTYNWATATPTVATSTTGGETSTVTSSPTAGQPTSATNGTSNTSTYVYDAAGRVTRETRPEGDYTNFAYDTRGNVIETRLVAKPGQNAPADIVTTASYDAECANVVTCNSPNSVTDAKGNQTEYFYDATHGGVTRVRLPAPAAQAARPETNYVYTSLYPQVRNTAGTLVNATDPQYRLTQITSCATGETCAGTAGETKISFAYATPNLQLTSVTRASGVTGNGALSATTSYTYDALDNLKTEDGPLPGSADTTTYVYDGQNRRIGVIAADPDGTGGRKRQAVRYSYDTESRVTKIERGAVAGAGDADLVGMTALETVDVTYDAKGNRTRESLSGGSTTFSVTEYSYDADKRLTCTAIRMNPGSFASAPSDACAPNTATNTVPDRITRNTYDANGRVTKVQAAVGTTSAADAVSLAYTANGDTSWVADANGNRTTYIYDRYDRPQETHYPVVGTPGTSSSSDYEGVVRDANGNITNRRLRDAKEINYSYDALNRLTFKDVPDGAWREFDVSYGYDTMSRLTSASSASVTNGTAVALSWDALGRQTGEGELTGSKAMQFDLAGNLTRLTWPDGFAVDYDRTALGEVSAIRESGTVVSPITLVKYGYDDLGRRTTITRGNDTSPSTTYAYDGVSRLASLAHDLAGTANDVTTTFTYNAAWQIASANRDNDAYAYTGNSNKNLTETPNALNQLTAQLTAQGDKTFGYDGRGNLASSSTGNVFSYTSENRLAGTNGNVSLFYDPLGRLLDYNATSAGGTDARFLHLGDNVIAELSTAGAVQRRFVWGPGADEIVVSYEGSGTGDRRWITQDQRGSTTAMLNSAGSVLGINKYDEYGVPASTNIGRFGYTGQAWLPESGLYHYKARAYAPTLGRFLQPDPIGYGDGPNMYNYVGGDPVNFADPSGLITAAQCARLRAEGNIVSCGHSDPAGGGGGGNGFGGNGGGSGGAGEGGVVRRPGPAPAPPVEPVPEKTPSLYCKLAGLLGANGRLRLGVDLAGGIGPYLKGGFGVSLRGDGSFEGDAYFGAGAGGGILAGVGLGVDNAGSTARGNNGTGSREISGGFGVPVYGPIGFGGSGSIPLGPNVNGAPTLQSGNGGGGFSVGPKYGLAAGLTDTAMATARSNARCP